ncbi:MAG: UvrD-helicase domain-containing protein [Burkholderiales bacterium]
MTADAKERAGALDPARSFIVQAPAGSGKTALLIQRFLVLLARVERPEQVVALTFTRKAASEMKSRIVTALSASEPAGDAKVNEKTTWQLAQRVRDRDVKCGWHVAENPSQLSIQTIDAFCSRLARSMPLSSELGGVPETVEDAETLYVEAARETISHLNTATSWSPAIEILLEHLDNDWPRLESLLVPMLERRDQWLRGVSDRVDRERCETALKNVIEDALMAAVAARPKDVTEELLALARYAGERLEEGGRESPIRNCRSLVALADCDLAGWLGLAELLLTKNGEWRKGVSVTTGFPAGARGSQMKARMRALLDKVAQCEDFRECLRALRGVPSASYTDEQWRVLRALLEVLKLAAAELSLVFRRRGQIDFIGITHAALSALGGDTEPTDLALALDARIEHLLVDEFQDTSVSQYELIARLTAGWQPHDGRTVFLVGDPMQSIYGFRQAEVGLFLEARNNGIGNLKPDPLTLGVNFRSHSGLVEWVNRTFAKVLPAREDIGEGAVPFSPATANVSVPEGFKIGIHPFFDDVGFSEAKQVTAIAAAARANNQTVVVLVRSRAHLALIAPQLAAAGLRFRAVEIERLEETQVVRDLTSLTRAYLHPADRIAWLSILRAPWCGLTLADLERLAVEERALWDSIQDEATGGQLSADGQARLTKVKRTFAAAFEERGRRTLRRAVEGIWLALGGPACAPDQTALANAELYLSQLPDLENDAPRADKLFAAPDASAGNELQLMTIHKAKGLEFDVVIVPGLGRKPGKNDSALLMWAERAGKRGVDLLLAPIPAITGKGEAIYDYLREREKRREKLEEGRLLYVAATRAKQSLHLLGHVALPADPRKEIAPVSSSSLAILWRALAHEFTLHAALRPQKKSDELKQRPLCRLPIEWNLPVVPASVEIAAVAPVSGETAIDYFWVTDVTRHIGSVVHQTLARIGREGIERWPASRISALKARHAAALAHLGVPPSELEHAAAEVERALLHTLHDARGRWIFDPRHQQDQSEYALTGVDAGELVSVVLDRTFVDENGERWIVDFKTGIHRGADAKHFLDNEKMRYAPQLERYARIMKKLDPRPIRLGLYFPLLKGWREWQAS